MWLSTKRWLIIFFAAMSLLGLSGCEQAAEINTPTTVSIQLIKDEIKIFEGRYLLRFQRTPKDLINLGKEVEKLLFKDWQVESPPELKISKQEAKVDLAEGNVYEIKPILTISAAPETTTEHFTDKKITVLFPHIGEIAKFLEIKTPIPRIEFVVTHYASYGKLGFDKLVQNSSALLGCGLFVGLMFLILAGKWERIFENIWYVFAAIGLFSVGFLGIPYFSFEILKNIGWILSGFFGA